MQTNGTFKISPAPPNLALHVERLLGSGARSRIDAQLVRLRPALRTPALPLPIALETDEVGRIDGGDSGAAVSEGVWRLLLLLSLLLLISSRHRGWTAQM